MSPTDLPIVAKSEVLPIARFPKVLRASGYANAYAELTSARCLRARVERPVERG